MTKEEALIYLELPVTASVEEVKTRIEERLAEYETLSEKAPSDFLRRLNKRSLEKVRAIKKESAQWPAFNEVAAHTAEIIIPEELTEKEALTVYIVPSLKDAVLKDAENKEVVKKRLTGDPAGWLIKHTEEQPAKTYPVKTGINFTGRKQQAGMEPFIVIEGDDFISRLQCVLYAEENDTLEFYVSNPSSFNNGKTSKNGTFINGNSEAVTKKIKLTDGDTIQVGVTKLVLRFNTGIDIDSIVKEVEQSKYVNTVVLDAS